MKSKVIIENGKTEIVLTPENEFERNMIEIISDSRKSTDAKFRYQSGMAGAMSHSITISANINDQ